MARHIPERHYGLPGTKPLKQVAFYIPVELHTELEKRAEMLHASLSGVGTQLLQAGLIVARLSEVGDK